MSEERGQVMGERFDVVAVNLQTKRVRILATDKDERNADAIIDMAVFRRGVETEFYRGVPAGSHKDGEELHFDER